MGIFQVMLVGAMLATGMGVALLGSVKVPLAERLHLDEAKVGGLLSIFGFCMIPMIFTAGFLTDLVGKQAVFLGGGLGLSAGLVWLALARSYPSACGAVVLQSASWSLLVNVGNVLIPMAFPGPLAYATNLANVFFGLGAFLTPLAVTYFLSRASFPSAVGILALLVLIPAGLALGVDFEAPLPAVPAGDTGALPADQGFAAVLGDPLMWLCALAMFFYIPLEISMGAWTTTYLGEQGISLGRAASLLSGFWLAFMLSRLITAFTLPKGAEALLILVLALAAVGLMIGVVASRTPAMAAVMVLGAGLAFGAIFPTIMAVLLGHFPGPVRGRAVGLFFAIGGVGWTLFPLLIGAYARRTSVQRGFTIAIVAALGLSLAALLLLIRLAAPAD